MHIKDLLESPQWTSGTDFGFEIPEYNVIEADAVMRMSNKTALQKIGNGTHTLYALPRAFVMLNHEDPDDVKVAYYMRYVVEYYDAIRRQCAQQVQVWRDKGDLQTDGTAANIFFNHLLYHYKTVITDEQQTSAGEAFWDLRIASALNRHMYVYYANVAIPPSEDVIHIKSYKEYRRLKAEKEIWGHTPDHKNKRLIITTSKL